MKWFTGLLLLCPLSASAQFTIPQATAANAGSGGGGAVYAATVSQNFHVTVSGSTTPCGASGCEFGSNPTPGDLIACIIISTDAAHTISSVTDQAGTPNSYTVVGPYARGGYSFAYDGWGAYYVAGATANKAIKITFDSTASANVSCVDEGVTSGTPIFDVSGGADQYSSALTPINTPALTVAASGEFMYAGADDSISFGTFASAIWTVLSPGYFGGNQTKFDEYFITLTGGSNAINATNGANTSTWLAYAMAFK